MIPFFVKSPTLRSVLTLAVACGLLSGAALYYYYGHTLISAIYRNESLELLNGFIGGEQDLYLLEYYLAKADRMVQQGLLFCSMFLVLLFARSRY